MSDRDRRLTRLERKPGRKPRVILVWRDVPHESAEEAIARRCPKGVPAGTEVVVCSWQEPGPAMTSGG